LTWAQVFSNVSCIMRLYHPSAFDFTTAVPSYWEATAPVFDREALPLQGAHTADVAIIGGGYAGLHAALVLAREHGLKVKVLDAGHVGWGASGRNGGFCCPGSVKLSYGELINRFGLEETKRFYKVQRDAVRFVGDFLEAEGIDADRTGAGEMEVAHKPSRVEELKADQRFMRETFGDDSAFYSREELAERGFDSPAFHGGDYLVANHKAADIRALRFLDEFLDKNVGVQSHKCLNNTARGFFCFCQNHTDALCAFNADLSQGLIAHVDRQVAGEVAHDFRAKRGGIRHPVRLVSPAQFHQRGALRRCILAPVHRDLKHPLPSV
jgi:hypothetical protein